MPLVNRVVAPLLLALALPACAAAPLPESLTPAERAAVCANLASTELVVEKAYCERAGFGDEASEAAELACAAFKGQLAEYRDRYGCQ